MTRTWYRATLDGCGQGRGREGREGVHDGGFLAYSACRSRARAIQVVFPAALSMLLRKCFLFLVLTQVLVLLHGFIGGDAVQHAREDVSGGSGVEFAAEDASRGAATFLERHVAGGYGGEKRKKELLEGKGRGCS